MHNKKTFGGAVKWLQQRIESEGTPFHRFFMEIQEEPLLVDTFDEAEMDGLDGTEEVLKEILKVVELPLDQGGLNFSGSTTVHRYLFMNDIDELKREFGAHWTHDAALFRRSNYFKNFDESFKKVISRMGLERGFILQGNIRPKDINLTETLKARMSYPEEEEIFINKLEGNRRSIRNVKVYRYQDFYDGKSPIKSY